MSLPYDSPKISHLSLLAEQTNKSDEEQQQQKTEEQVKTEQQQQEEKKEFDPQQRIKELEGELKQSNDDLLRALAERENLVRISKNNVENAKIYGIKSFAEGMLEVADNLGRALSSVPPVNAPSLSCHAGAGQNFDTNS